MTDPAGAAARARSRAPEGGSTPRRRRTTEEVRRRMLDAANELFAEHGYEQTTTKAIAERAQVTEPLLFRHFTSKAGLLRELLLESLTEFVQQSKARWDVERATTTVAERTRDYITSLYDLLRSNRQLILAAPAETLGRSDAALASAMAEPFRVLAEAARTDLQVTHSRDADLGVRFTFGLVASVALLDGWLFDDVTAPDRETMLDDLTAYVLRRTAIKRGSLEAR